MNVNRFAIVNGKAVSGNHGGGMSPTARNYPLNYGDPQGRK
jgi:hypothetical protein